MPRIAQPKMELEVREAIDVVRNPVNFAILSTLMLHGVQTRGQIVERLELGKRVVQSHLEQLRGFGLIEALPIAEPDGSHHRIVYRAVAEEVARRYALLGRALGLTGPLGRSDS